VQTRLVKKYNDTSFQFMKHWNNALLKLFYSVSDQDPYYIGSGSGS